ncbi:hypothetical protein N7474_001772 [Penicillium riverlandense]|uniref:uncharacterized protein n=1 Tax=Penicillium riverlandense TaxID=1903569 RepID=UPI002548FCC3|nr:uncharacterized protein N7474_001772 [Penicillium riverlandense]KAJ5833461.1 hypothetical protein N7474_001772 [Penicillium riverlandense]
MFHHGDSPSPRRDQYTIAWICALPIEMAAAQAVLDEIHESLPIHADDSNTYVLGSIKGHNVVIACLPSDQYGIINAANVVTNTRRTFTAIRVGLMVGIGGGVPGKVDVRLGDIVVGSRVMQTDLGKIVRDGKLEHTGIPRLPHQLLGTVVSTLRAKHELGPSRVPSILQQKLEEYGYGHPRSPDRLFLAAYHHEGSAVNCDECDHSKLVPRTARMSDDPMVHYGAVASGSQVMKNGVIRDEVARQLNVICFEMEAAGLMDILPCLPIRGICDYADSHKSKEWQKYAAATAAAYARELLEELPVIEAYGKEADVLNPDHCPSQERASFLDSLKFEQIDARKSSIETAHAKTCRWFHSHPDYKAWLDPAKLTQHHGFLWISGKPGAGKSTIMKFAYLSMRNKARHNNAISASYFFNARGELLEKSISGMYRSLLLQLLQGFPDLQTVLDDPELVSQCQNACPSLNVLKDLLFNAVSALGQRSFTCFVDALDECDEQQVVDMIQYFEDLAEHSVTKGVPLRICFSSRHYPYITIQRGIRLTLEHQPGHAEDLEAYVSSRLRIEDTALFEELRPQILGKADGVFMWVVLVVDILNKEYRRGAMALRRRLAEIPSHLSDLFKDILRRDNENMEELLLCILWILCAKRPLQPKEFYHALWSGLTSQGMVDYVDSEIPDVSVPATSGSVSRCHRYVISCSKGLAEVTKSERPSVQFIHESVRDFFIKDNGLHELWPELGFNWESLSHEKLKHCCNIYMTHTVVRTFVSHQLSEPKSNSRTEISNKYPFLEYACQHILYHANAAAKVVPQDDFLSFFDIPHWVSIHNLFEKFKIRKYSREANLFYILAERGLPELIRTRLKEDPDIDVLGERYRYPLFAALASGNRDTVAALLNSSSNIYDGVDIMEGLNYRQALKEYKNRTPLSWAAQDGRAVIVKLLLRTRTTVNGVDRGGQTPLSLASGLGHEVVVKLLIDQGADVNANNKNGSTPLSWASEKGYEVIARLLIDQGAEVNASDNSRRTPLSWASEMGYEVIARLLIDQGADINASDHWGRTPLSRASMNGHETVARLLIDQGADVNTNDESGLTSLSWAAMNGHEAVARLLIDQGADVNANGESRSIPLSWASINGHETVARLLIDQGADVNTNDESGLTSLSWAAMNGHEAVARLLIDQGADVNANDECGSTPLLWASTYGYEAMARLLVDQGADVNANDEVGLTPLSWASEKGYEVIARLLIDQGAEVNASDHWGRTPLSRASEKGYEVIARLLIDQGAEVNASDHSRRTPLSWASEKGYEVIARLLIDQGADINASDHWGRTPLSRAVLNDHEVVTRLLIDHGADVNAAGINHGLYNKT